MLTRGWGTCLATCFAIVVNFESPCHAAGGSQISRSVPQAYAARLAALKARLQAGRQVRQDARSVCGPRPGALKFREGRAWLLCMRSQMKNARQAQGQASLRPGPRPFKPSLPDPGIGQSQPGSRRPFR